MQGYISSSFFVCSHFSFVIDFRHVLSTEKKISIERSNKIYIKQISNNIQARAPSRVHQ